MIRLYKVFTNIRTVQTQNVCCPPALRDVFHTPVETHSPLVLKASNQIYSPKQYHDNINTRC